MSMVVDILKIVFQVKCTMFTIQEHVVIIFCKNVSCNVFWQGHASKRISAVIPFLLVLVQTRYFKDRCQVSCTTFTTLLFLWVIKKKIGCQSIQWSDNVYLLIYCQSFPNNCHMKNSLVKAFFAPYWSASRRVMKTI